MVVGPTVFDRLTGLGLIGNKTIVLLLVMGLASGRLSLFIDISIAYGLVNFVGTMALAKYFEAHPTEADLEHDVVPVSPSQAASVSPRPADAPALATGDGGRS